MTKKKKVGKHTRACLHVRARVCRMWVGVCVCNWVCEECAMSWKFENICLCIHTTGNTSQRFFSSIFFLGRRRTRHQRLTPKNKIKIQHLLRSSSYSSLHFHLASLSLSLCLAVSCRCCFHSEFTQFDAIPFVCCLFFVTFSFVRLLPFQLQCGSVCAIAYVWVFAFAVFLLFIRDDK